MAHDPIKTTGLSSSAVTIATALRPTQSAREVAQHAAELFRNSRWEDLARLSSLLPADWPGEWLPVADNVSFALGQLGRHEEAIALLVRADGVEPTHRRASSLAYLYYDALLLHKSRKQKLSDPEHWRKHFEAWITEALRRQPDSVVDRYRLGVYYASVLSLKDIQASRWFHEAIAIFDRGNDEARSPRSRLYKPFVRSLYGAARSAYRLRRYPQAQALIFRCIRVDRETNHVEALYKYFLAAKVLVAVGRLDDAERGLRLALEVEYQRERDFVYALLAEISLQRGDSEAARRWIEAHIRPHARKSYIWRLLGHAEELRGKNSAALGCYKSALLKDHGGRHKTLVAIGRVQEANGDWKAARQSYLQATEFRRRRFLSDDPAALEALAALCERRSDVDGAREAYARMSKLPGLAERAEEALARLAG